MDERARLGVRPGLRRGPELGAQVHRAELVRVDEREHARGRARAVVLEVREVVRIDPAEVVEHGVVAVAVVAPEPRPEARRVRGGAEVGEARAGVVLRPGGGRVHLRLLAGRAVRERRALGEAPARRVTRAASDDELASGDRGGERLDIRVNLGDLVVGAHGVEEVGRFDGVRAIARAGEVVRRRD